MHTHFDELSYLIRQYEKPALDEFCYDNYARLLIPRAVAYSAEIPRYFFRGDIDAVDAKTVTTDGKISGITMKVKNNTPGERLSLGFMKIACSYNTPGTTARSYRISADTFVLGIDSGQTTGDFPSGEDFKFTFPDPIPSDATGIEYMLVFRGGLGAEADAVAGKSFKPKDVLVIDDWENGQNWTTEYTSSTLSLATSGQYEGAGAMKMDVASGQAETPIYPVYPWHFYDYGYSGVFVTDFRRWRDGLGTCFATDGAAQKHFISGSNRTVSSVVVPMFRNDYSYYMDFIAVFHAHLYVDSEPFPGELVATSDTVQISLQDLSIHWWEYKPVKFPFPTGYKLDATKSYTVVLDCSEVTPSPPEPTYPLDYSRLSIITPIYFGLTGSLFFNYLNGSSCADGYVWGEYSSRDMVWTVYGENSPGLAKANISKDCTGYNTLKTAVKSTLTGNMINFIYGTDKDHTVTAHLNSSKTGWETIEIPISDSVDKSKLGYFAFKLGNDGIDADGKSKANTIYIDQLVAE